MHSNNLIIPENFILDVDGVLTDGKFYYDKGGKVFKVFGPDDHDAIKLLKNFLNIHAVTADQKGFEISSARVERDMDLSLSLVGVHERVDWISSKFNPQTTIYMGDGIFDTKVFESVFFGIAPANAMQTTKNLANLVTNCSGGDRAVAEACIYIAKVFFDTELV
jgi:3-deoxy-D-manno-octulosonate 8-phosphate phosphatase (KDO 8-P phosphatase)